MFYLAPGTLEECASFFEQTTFTSGSVNSYPIATKNSSLKSQKVTRKKFADGHIKTLLAAIIG
jgi:hypothetical protein